MWAGFTHWHHLKSAAMNCQPQWAVSLHTLYTCICIVTCFSCLWWCKIPWFFCPGWACSIFSTMIFGEHIFSSISIFSNTGTARVEAALALQLTCSEGSSWCFGQLGSFTSSAWLSHLGGESWEVAADRIQGPASLQSRDAQWHIPREEYEIAVWMYREKHAGYSHFSVTGDYLTQRIWWWSPVLGQAWKGSLMQIMGFIMQCGLWLYIEKVILVYIDIIFFKPQPMLMPIDFSFWKGLEV